MAYFRLGQLNYARQSLAEMERIVNEEMLALESGRIGVKNDPEGKHGWSDWLVVHILRREALRLIEGKLSR